MTAYWFGQVIGSFAVISLASAVVLLIGKLKFLRDRRAGVYVSAGVVAVLLSAAAALGQRSSINPNSGLATAIGGMTTLAALYWLYRRSSRKKSKGAHGTRATPEAGLDDASSLWPGSERGFLVRHWLGGYSLARSYWLHSFLLAGIAPLLIATALGELGEKTESLRMVAMIVLAFIAISSATWLWGIVGVWRSASLHARRGGGAGWAIAAKVMVVLGVLGTAGQFATRLGSATIEYAKILAGRDPVGDYKATLAPDGRSIEIRGGLREGIAKDVARLLDAAPGLQRVVLDSHGGRVLEARQLADLIRDRTLSTIVDGQCLSACTLVFLAGKERAASPNAKIGFHRFSFPGGTAEGDTASTSLERLYREAGLSRPFVDQIARTSADQMWYPSRAELISARVVTRYSLGGESTYSFQRMSSRQEIALAYREQVHLAAIEKRFPDAFDAILDSIWSGKQKGFSDAQLASLTRTGIGELLKRLLPHMDIAQLESVYSLLLEEAKEARTVGPSACLAVLGLTSDNFVGGAILSRQTGQKEAALFASLFLNVDPSAKYLPVVTETAGQAAVQRAIAKLPQKQIEVLSGEGSTNSSPASAADRCDTFVRYFEELLALPMPTRASALRYLADRN